eukprot:1158019-Pelagomonas_calceolata.AAC.4
MFGFGSYFACTASLPRTPCSLLTFACANTCLCLCSIITQDYVLVVNPEDAHAAALIQELRKKLRDPTHLGQASVRMHMHTYAHVCTMLLYICLHNAAAAAVAFAAAALFIVLTPHVSSPGKLQSPHKYQDHVPWPCSHMPASHAAAWHVMLQPAMSRLLASTAMQRAQRSGKTIGLSFELKVLEICLEKAHEHAFPGWKPTCIIQWSLPAHQPAAIFVGDGCSPNNAFRWSEI